MNSNNDLNPQDGLYIISKYKYIIALFTILGMILSAIYIYYKPKIYEATSSIQLNVESKNIEGADILTGAIFGTKASDIDTAKEVIKSRAIILETLNKVDLTKRVYGINRFFKSIELYEDIPFNIKLDKGYGTIFTLYLIDNDHFHLKAKGVDNSGKKFEYSGDFNFNQTIKNRYFTLTLIKNGKEFTYSKYRFIVDSPIFTAEDIVTNSLSVSRRSKKANILDISFQDTIPIRAKEFVNELTNVYLKRNIEQKTLNATNTLKFINQQLKILQGNLKRSQKNIEEFKSKSNTIDIKLSTQEISKKVSDYDSKIAIINMKISILKDIINKIKRGKNLSTITLVGLGVDSKSVNELTRELQQALLDRKSLLADYTPAHPVVKKLTERIENLKAIIKESIKNMIKTLNAQKDILLSQKSHYSKDLKKLPKVEQNYLTLQREFSFNNKFYTYLLEKKTETEIKKAATANQYKVLDYAITPQIPIKPKKKLIITVGTMMGAMVGLLVAFLLNLKDNTIKDESEITKQIEAPIVATIPKSKELNNNLVVLSKPKSAIAESFRLLRTNLQFLISEDRGSIISITSTVSGEGKTYISSNLAASLVMLDKRVIIINFDLRKPTLHKIFDVPNGYGLSGYLSNQIGLEKILKHTNIDNLDIITAGAIPPNPSELINSKKAEELLERLKKYYDYIILDTPPVGIVTDARVLIKRSNLTLYIVRANYTKKEYLKILKDIKDKVSNSFGIVLNDAKMDIDSNYGYNYYD